MKMLVTGGAGFIGSCFIRHILNKYSDYKVINLDALTYAGNIENLNDVKENPNYTFVKGNICDKSLVYDLTKDVDCIVNFAAESHVDRSIADPEIFVDTNIKGTLNLLQAVKGNKVSCYLQVSTDEVYGTLGKEGYFYETTPLAPNSPYSASKAGADLLVRASFETYKLPVKITRCSNNYGPYQYPEKLIPFFISRLLKGEKVPVYGDGLNVRDWLYVYDHCSAIDRVLHKGRVGECYILGNKEVTLKEMCRMLHEASGCKTPFFYVPISMAYKLAGQMEKKAKKTGEKPMMTNFAVYNLARNNHFDYSKAERELGYHTRPYEETLRDEAQWLKKEGFLEKKATA